jgi:pantoate--beta-alanine ligase
MVIFKKIEDLRAFLDQKKQAGAAIGFVPTMGALHEGHRSLIDAAKQENLFVVCSIFVNPTQFNEKSDFEKYPVSTDADIAILTDAGCDVLFLPSVTEMYPDGTDKGNNYTFGYLETILEGALRPGHFKGVGQVVARLLEIVRPDQLFMGQKDYQQCMVIRSLLQQMNTGQQTTLVICPTKREADGLAMSSRNRRLTEPQRILAGLLYQCLISVVSKQASDPFSIVRKECTELLEAKGVQPEYVALADARDLRLLEEYDASVPTVALIAARVGDVRLIDNMLL